MTAAERRRLRERRRRIAKSKRVPMTYRAACYVTLEQLPLTAVEARVGRVLVSYAAADGTSCHPGLRAIARRARTSNYRAVAAIRRLEAFGFLRKVRQGGGRQRGPVERGRDGRPRPRGVTNAYRIVLRLTRKIVDVPADQVRRLALEADRLAAGVRGRARVRELTRGLFPGLRSSERRRDSARAVRSQAVARELEARERLAQAAQRSDSPGVPIAPASSAARDRIMASLELAKKRSRMGPQKDQA